jgi:protein SCO1/2
VPTEVTENQTTPALSEAERADAFRRDDPKVPRNFALWVIGAFVVLGLGGALAEHLLSTVGLNPGSTSPTTTPTFAPAVLAPPGGTPSAQELDASLPAYMGITAMPGSPAPAISLVDQSGRALSLADERGDAVVVTFFDSPCEDICPVVSAEILHAAATLGPQAAHVVFLTVNTDPDVLSAAPASAAAARTGLAALPSWHFLTSTLGNLNQVWKNYGVTVNVSPSTGLVAHNDVMYFIGPDGRLRYRATPFADENAAGVYSLSPDDIARWGQGIATYAGRLLGSTP